MENKVKVSIIIPVFNVELYVKESLRSVLDQTYDNIEVLIVDDRGSDNSMDVVREVLSEHPNAHKATVLTHKKNHGLSVARNTGIDASTGDYLYFIDSDDTISLDCIEKLVEPLSVYGNVDIVVGDYYKVYEYNGIKGPFLDHQDGLIEGHNIIMNTYFTNRWLETAWNKLINRSFLLDNQLCFEPGVVHEDILWTFKVINTVNKLCFSKEAIYYYLIREGSIMSQKLPLRLNDLSHVYNQMVEYGIKNYMFDNRYSVSYLVFMVNLTLNDIIKDKDLSFAEKKYWYKYLRQSLNRVKKNISQLNCAKGSFMQKFHLYFSQSFGFWCLNIINLFYRFRHNAKKAVTKVICW